MGTGKTEAVKALGDQLGRFVLVFNCDEAFDFQAMGRFLMDCVRLEHGYDSTSSTDWKKEHCQLFLSKFKLSRNI